jgi:tRNA1Val (adenine37-N6)-methyltransferase
MFRFKQFSVSQSRSSMKVCTDSCFFGAVIEASSPVRILDLGTGTGLLALMLAQKFEKAEIEAVEIEEGAYTDAAENFKNAIFSKRLILHHADIRHFSSVNKYDLIVCNPPFYENHLASVIHSKNIAHHAVALRFDELILALKRLSGPETDIWILLPPSAFQDFNKKASQSGFFLHQKLSLSHEKNHRVLRIIACFSKKSSLEIKEDSYYIYDDRAYSERFKSILKEFYLIF